MSFPRSGFHHLGYPVAPLCLFRLTNWFFSRMKRVLWLVIDQFSIKTSAFVLAKRKGMICYWIYIYIPYSIYILHLLFLCISEQLPSNAFPTPKKSVGSWHPSSQEPQEASPIAWCLLPPQCNRSQPESIVFLTRWHPFSIILMETGSHRG